MGITKEKDFLLGYILYGLSDIFTRTLRPIKHSEDSKELYYKKVRFRQDRFHGLIVVD